MRAGFGLGRVHHLFSRGERERVVRGAMDAGFRHFDLAPAYGEGLAERELGRILGARRDEVTITTKFGIPYRAIGEWPMPVYFGLRAAGKALKRSFGADYSRRDFSARAMVESLEASLRRMGTPHVDYLLVHEPLSLAEFRALGPTWSELEKQRAKGKVRRYGVSSLTPMLLEAEAEGLVPAEAVRMAPMTEQLCAQPQGWFEAREVFVFNIVKYVSRMAGSGAGAGGGGAGGGRIETKVLVEKFAQALPLACPIFATHQVDEMKRMGEAWRGVGGDAPMGANG